MSFADKICLVNIGGVILLAFLLSTFSSGLSPGISCLITSALIIGGLNTFAGLLLLFNTDKKYARACLISGGLLFLFGFLTCSSLLLN